jgi:hypothetical protein
MSITIAYEKKMIRSTMSQKNMKGLFGMRLRGLQVLNFNTQKVCLKKKKKNSFGKKEEVKKHF